MDAEFYLREISKREDEFFAQREVNVRRLTKLEMELLRRLTLDPKSET